MTDTYALDLDDLRRARRLCETGAARAIRLATRVKVREIARAADVSPAAVSLWERGLRVPSSDAALRYLVVLDRLVGSSP